eukprot:TRINITY_DN5232_c0_g2_i1.p2 TRINITY_DN5232_c0_g2~~TRINITY_DN5232_c0_g2_i1.p2  ORF type:complete len:297 (+),score=57.26 TRINITY_DN5232_c0_g2_i1:132-1022(+)
MATIGEIHGSHKRPRWADLADSSCEQLPEPDDEAFCSSFSRADRNKRPRWADLQDSSAEQLPELPDPLRRSFSIASNLNDESMQIADSESMDGLRRALSRTMSEVRKTGEIIVDDDKAAERASVGEPSEPRFVASESRQFDVPAAKRIRPSCAPGLQLGAAPANAKGKSKRSGFAQQKTTPTAKVKSMEKTATEPADAAASLNVSDEEWQRRVEKRCAIVASTKELPAYQALLAERELRRERGSPSRSPSAPRTPDPHDRGISKRSWEKAIADWRHHFKDVQHFQEVQREGSMWQS